MNADQKTFESYFQFIRLNRRHPRRMSGVRPPLRSGFWPLHLNDGVCYHPVS